MIEFPKKNLISEAGVCETQHFTCLSFVLCGPIIDGTFPNSNGSVNLLCTTQVEASKKIKKKTRFVECCI